MIKHPAENNRRDTVDSYITHTILPCDLTQQVVEMFKGPLVMQALARFRQFKSKLTKDLITRRVKDLPGQNSCSQNGWKNTNA